jgi:hypothetical protein
MALVIRGTSKCLLCGETLKAQEEIVSFPAFLAPFHQLHRYSDASMHERCFESSEDRNAVTDLYSRWRAIWESRPQNLGTVSEMEAWSKAAFAEFEGQNPAKLKNK